MSLSGKGLDISSLLDMPLPDDLTLAEARDAVMKSPKLQPLWKMAKSQEKIRIIFGWCHKLTSEEVECPDTFTLAEWKNTPYDYEVYLAIDDKGGGTTVKSPEPELV